MTGAADRLQQALAATADGLLAYFERRVARREDAADLVGEVMLQAWRRADVLPDDAERQRMWLFTIAGNVLTNHRRSAVRRTALADRLRATLRSAPPEPAVAEDAAVRDAVRRLPDQQRELVMLVHWDGFTLAEAAIVLGVNASTARSRYAAARAALRVALAEPSPVTRAVGI